MAFSRWISWLLVSMLLFHPGPVKNNSHTFFQPVDIILYVDTTSDFNDAAHQACTAHSINDCSLRGAITLANRDLANHYIIDLQSATYNLSLNGDDDTNKAGDLDISVDLEIEGRLSYKTLINANQIDRVFHIQPGAQVTITQLTIQNGLSHPSQGGGGIYNAGDLSLETVYVHDSSAGNGLPAENGGSGGGMLNVGRLSMQHCNVTENHAGAGGNGPPTYDGGDGGSGGGIANFGQIDIKSTYLERNYTGSGGNGGQSSVYLGNTLGGDGGDGGGLYNAGTLIAENVSIRWNQTAAAGVGDVFYKYSGSVSGVPGKGGGVYNTAYIKLTESRIIGNVTTPAIKKDNTYSLEGYYAGHGGGVYNAIQATFALNEVDISANQSSGRGGGIFNAGRTDLIGGLIDQNNARQGGGGIYNNGTLTADRVSINENSTGPGYDGYQSSCFGCSSFPPLAGESPDGGGLLNAGVARLNNIQANRNVTGDGGKGSDSSGSFAGSDGGYGGSGGGIANLADLQISLSTIQGNHTGKGGEAGSNSYFGDGMDGNGGSGGGIYNTGKLSAAFLTIRDNFTNHGFLLSQPAGMGGGLASLGKMSLGGSQVQGNRTPPGGNGGGIYIAADGIDQLAALISNTKVISNTSGADGGGLYADGRNVNLENVLVAGNRVVLGRSGNGLFLQNQHTTARHLTLAGNTEEYGSGICTLSATAAFTNSIIAGQYIGITVAEDAIVDMQATLWGADSWANGQDWLVNGTLLTGTLNLHADPLFVDPTKMDFHLSGSSPAVDAGIVTSLVVDMDNQPRPNPATAPPDIGADEVWALSPVGNVEIQAPDLIRATLPVTLTARIEPGQATPLVSYIWYPEPLGGQGTAVAVYDFDERGVQAVTV
jgi:hypothetical protein